MVEIQSVPGSFRDPAGRVYQKEGRILRAVAEDAAVDFKAVMATGFLQRLIDDGRLLDFSIASVPSELALQWPRSTVLEHPRLHFVSHPYEWSFEALRAAALLHLDIQLDALAEGIALSDASAYNIQFIGTKPVFIDVLSFRTYRTDELWAGYRQFCEQLLNPLLLCAATGIMPNAWYRGTVEGVQTAELRRLMPLPALLSRRALLHVVAHAMLERGSLDVSGESATIGLPRKRFDRLLRDLRAWIGALHPRRGESRWSHYEATCSYSDEEREAKRREVAEFAAAVRPAQLWDMGCNIGEYALVAVACGALSAIGWDSDARGVDAAFLAAQAAGAPFTPLVTNIANPSPKQGWDEDERLGLRDRATADALIALALLHHLVFGHNVPLPHVVAWLVGLAPRGLIEFVPADDVQVRPMLSRRTGRAHRYDRDLFTETLSKLARVQRSKVLGASGREVFWYDRSA